MCALNEVAGVVVNAHTTESGSHRPQLHIMHDTVVGPPQPTRLLQCTFLRVSDRSVHTRALSAVSVGD